MSTEQSATIQNIERCYAVVIYILFVLYILVIIIMLKNRKKDLKGPFLLCLPPPAFRTVATLVWYFGYDLPRLAVFRSFYIENGRFVATVLGTACGYTVQLSRAMNLLLALNRMSDMKSPAAYKVKSVAAALMVTLGLSAQYTIGFGYYGGTYYPVGNSSSLILLITKPDIVHYRIWMFWTSMAAMVMVPIFAVVYGVAFWHVHNHYKEKKNQVVSIATDKKTMEKRERKAKRFKAEFNLLLISFFLSFSQMALSINVGLAFLSPQTFIYDDPYGYMLRWAIITQMDSLMNPLLLLIMSTHTRECFIKFVNCHT